MQGEARTVGWKHPEAIGILSAAYSETGDLDAAAKWRAKATDLTPGIMNKLMGKTLVYLMQQQRKSLCRRQSLSDS